MKIFHYKNWLGRFSYDKYVAVQTAGNHRKINNQWIDEANVAWLCGEIRREIPAPTSGICHGTRRGLEQRWFRAHLGCEVIGTEISDTATQFPNTIQWDFHEVQPGWIGYFDFVYSNSWDHSYDPQKLFTAWMSCVRPGGLMILTHSEQHNVLTELDPLAMTQQELIDTVLAIGGNAWQALPVGENPPTTTVGLDGTKSLPCQHIIFRRTA